MANPGLFDVYATLVILSGPSIYPRAVLSCVQTPGPFGREDLRRIAHRLMNIADFDTDLRE